MKVINVKIEKHEDFSDPMTYVMYRGVFESEKAAFYYGVKHVVKINMNCGFYTGDTTELFKFITQIQSNTTNTISEQHVVFNDLNEIALGKKNEGHKPSGRRFTIDTRVVYSEKRAIEKLNKRIKIINDN